MEKRPWVLAGPPITTSGLGIAVRLKILGDEVNHPVATVASYALFALSGFWIVALVVHWLWSPRVAPGPEIGPRRLTPRQSAQIVQVLSGRIGHMIICCYAYAPDSNDLAEDLAATFRKAGWKVDVSMQPTKPRVPPPTGIAIELPGDQAPQPDPKMSDAQVRALLGEAMVAAGISVNIRPRTEIWSYAQCCIIIGARP